MVDLVLSLALPFLVAVAVAGVLRLSAGPERGGRLTGAGLAVGFLGWWLWARGLSPMVAEPIHLAPHVTLGGLLLGAAADGWIGRRAAAWAVAAVFSAACLWALAGMPGDLAAVAAQGLPLLAVAALWGLSVAVPARAATTAPAALLLLAMAALGLAGAAAAFGVAGVTAAALALAAASLGVLVWGPAAAAQPGWVPALAGGGTFTALAAALVAAEPGAAGPLAVLALVFLAEPTAARLPAGGARLATLARPLWLAAVAAVPAALAGFLAQVAARVSSG
ncbi:hypothetical protein [Caenispirillum bisanense]|uniref:Uncharacterized protein n=1 Tax=Caenispirillum bisanense TaxID=414052 RepID=A0A286G274_9PROT|nr:hypothetical protein [Caenispirillum bisanense]SOD89637.1 hypothetical protein SAMN05421508_101285 [Caenispirillum bisanense]